MIALALKILRKYSTPDTAFSFIRMSTRLFPRSVGILKEFCINRIAVRDFDAVIKRCTEIATAQACTDSLKDVASTYLVRASLEDDAAPETLSRLWNASRTEGAASTACFKAGDHQKARLSFGESLRLAKVPARAIPEWLAAFDAIAGIDSDQLPSQPPVIEQESVRKLVVSGMYWSGSGAIYDYLREFEQVSPVDGELRLWKEGDFCLDSLSFQIHDREVFKQSLFRFLTIALTGTSPIANWREELASGYALSSSTAAIGVNYANVCRRFAEEAAACVQRNGDTESCFKKAASCLSDGLVVCWLGKRPEMALLDNVVHIGGIGAIRLLGNAIALCSFRDPRSNFVARWNENPRFNRDVARYIDYYKETIARFEAALARAPELSSVVHRVCFEQFIASEEYRDSLAIKCGLDLARRNKGRFFRPTASRKNIANYLDFPDQEIIKRIERELGEYCVEPLIQ